MSLRFPACLAAATILTASLAVPGRAQDEQPTVTSRLVLEQPAGGVARVEAFYPSPAGETCPTKVVRPLRARYRGRLHVVHTGDGRLAVVDDIPFSDYLKGLSEVPRSWPQEALRAQVIAARSYALYQIAHPRPGGRAIGYDICSTDRCQVYRGTAVEQGAFGERWVAAVDDTSGLALVHGGVPIQAFYFSTSSGRTRTNEEVFGGAALPYFRPVSGEDGDSPLARWSSRVPLDVVTASVRAAGVWTGGAISSARRSGDRVTLSDGSRSSPINATTFRNALNREAPCVAPGAFPPRRADGSRLPQTVPSIRYTIRADAGAVVVEGRGWGHDVGMSQYGAKSLAERGRAAADILAHFYGGLRPQRVSEPGTIRVLVVEAALRVRITPENGGTLRSEEGSEFGGAPTYEIAAEPDGARVRRVSGTTLEPVLEARDLGVTRNETSVVQRVSLSGPARVRATVAGGGVEVGTLPETSFERGEHQLTVPLQRAPDPGPYEVTVEAFDGIDRVRFTSSFTVDPPPRTQAPSPAGADRSPLIVAAFAAAALGAGVLALRLSRR